MPSHPLGEPLVARESDDTKPRSFVLHNGVGALYSHRAPEKESPNEDVAIVIPVDEQTVVLAVADGMGGGRAGKEAAWIAIDTLREKLSTVTPGGGLREAILDAFDAANAAVLALGIGAATTLAVVEVQGNILRPYHVGDSVILVFGQRGRMRFQCVMHSPVGYAVEAGVLGENEAVHHEDRHLVSNVVGAADMRIEIGPAITLSHYDTVLLASDGLVDNLYIEEIVEDARKGPAARAVRQLVARCERRMRGESSSTKPSKADDLTVLLYRQR
jgi:serine/threonine protein phosphatase PrpC